MMLLEAWLLVLHPAVQLGQRVSDLFGPAPRGSEVRSNPLPQYLIWRQDRRGAPLQIYNIYSKS